MMSCPWNSSELHRQPSHHAGSEEVAQGMLAMCVVECVKDGNRQLGFSHMVTCLFSPEEEAKPEIEEVVAADIF